MPTKNEPTDLSTGTLYIKALDGDLLPLEIQTEPTDTPIPDEVKTFFAAAAEMALEICVPVFDFIVHVVEMVGDIAKWGAENRPKLAHLTRYAKTARRRKKNARRIMQEYFREVHRCG